MQREDFAICSFCDASQDLVPIADQKLIVGLEEWRGLVLAGKGLSGRSPTDIPLVDNRREKSGKIPTSVCLSRILASQTQPGLSSLAQRLVGLRIGRCPVPFITAEVISTK